MLIDKEKSPDDGEEGGVEVPMVATLEGFGKMSEVTDTSLHFDDLADGDRIEFKTLNTLYELTVIDIKAGKFLIKGGRYFPEPTPVFITGCTVGGSMLKGRAFIKGLRPEIFPEDKSILDGGDKVDTSPIEAIFRVK